MVDMVSYVGDILSFYLDYQANESFLQTSTEYAKSNDYVQYFVDGKIVESYSLIDTPRLINTTIVHEVINKSNIARYAWIWSYNDTYENAKAQLLNG